jgi:hypothetical protein
MLYSRLTHPFRLVRSFFALSPVDSLVDLCALLYTDLSRIVDGESRLG